MTVPEVHRASMRRCRRVIATFNRRRLVESLPILLIAGLVVVALVRGETTAGDAERRDQISQARSDDRDAARAYQRCLQQRPVALVVSVALDEYPELRARAQAEHPDALDRDGRLTVPDCEGTYPRGAAVSRLYPDIAPTTTPTPRRTP